MKNIEDVKNKIKTIINNEVSDINNYDTESLTPPYYDMELTFKEKTEIDNYIGKIIDYAARMASDIVDDINEY